MSGSKGRNRYSLPPKILSCTACTEEWHPVKKSEYVKGSVKKVKNEVEWVPCRMKNGGKSRGEGETYINCALCPTTSVPGASVMGAGGGRIGVMGGKICDKISGS